MLHEGRPEVELVTVPVVRSLEVDVTDKEFEVRSRDEVASLHPGETLATELVSLMKVERMKKIRVQNIGEKSQRRAAGKSSTMFDRK
jgi:hypothetical protein